MKRGAKIFLGILFGLFVVAAVSFITQQLWNWLVPVLFAGPLISFWQAAGLLVLSKILFSGLGGKCHGHGKHSPGSFWKKRMYSKFSNMSSEEREEFKRKLRDRWCSPAERREERDAND